MLPILAPVLTLLLAGGARAGPPGPPQAPASQVGTELPAGVPATWVRAPSRDVPLANGDIIAGDLVRLSSFAARMYYDTHFGIGSSLRGWFGRWRQDPGHRLDAGGDEREAQGVPGHPTAIWNADGSLRMYYQVAIVGVDGPPIGLYSAISRDRGLHFEREGVRITAGGGSLFSGVGHGRAWRRNDGSVGLAFSADRADRPGPAAIYLATSVDGLAFDLRPEPVFVNGHDPAVLRLPDGRLWMIFQYLLDEFRVTESADDGETWSPAAPIHLRNADGSPYVGSVRPPEDVTWERGPRGGLRLWVNCPGVGLCAFVPLKAGPTRSEARSPAR